MTYCTDNFFFLNIFIKFGGRVPSSFLGKIKKAHKEDVYFLLLIWKIKVLSLAWCMIFITKLSLNALFATFTTVPGKKKYVCWSRERGL
jgi:hypothetical protein